MGLSDTVKDLQKKAESKELQLLKEAKRYMDVNSEDVINARGRKIMEFEDTAQGQTIEGKKWIVREMAELNRICDYRRLYSEILRFATRAERARKGAGEAFVQRNADLIRRKKDVIEETYRKTLHYQMELEVLKESDKVGDFV